MRNSLISWKTLSLVSVLIILLAVFLAGPKALRVYRVIHLFDEDVIVGNFLGMEKVFPVKTMSASPEPFVFAQGEPMVLPGGS